MSSILHHNDGKEKQQSHQVYSKNLEGHFDISLQGFGSTKEEAYSEFISKLDQYIDKIHQFRNQIDIENTVKVDCFGEKV